MSLQKKLFIANGRWENRQHIFVCGYSKSDAISILEELSGSRSMKNEMDKYFNKGSWGKAMDGIEIERGAWITDNLKHNPKRIYPIGIDTIIKKDHYNPNAEMDLCSTCFNFCFGAEYPCKECIHYVGEIMHHD